MKKRILIKISGELFRVHNQQFDGQQERSQQGFDYQLVQSLALQVKELSKSYQIGFVIGGGNFFRGSIDGKYLHLKKSVADNVGMLATVMNGLILQECLLNEGVPCTLLSAIAVPRMVEEITQKKIDLAFEQNQCIVFAGGTGNQFFTTDTNAIVRALQIEASEVWKATKVDFIYTDDPIKNPDSKPIKSITYEEALNKHLKIMDSTALTLASEYGIIIRVFNLFVQSALLKVASQEDFGSTIFSKITI